MAFFLFNSATTKAKILAISVQSRLLPLEELLVVGLKPLAEVYLSWGMRSVRVGPGIVELILK